MKLIPIILLAVFLLTPVVGSAHLPRLVESNITNVENPEVSQAFYGELKGVPDIYVIESDISFKLYASLLVPATEGIEKDLSVKICRKESDDDDDVNCTVLDGMSHEWTLYYEEFGGDYYYNGPELVANQDGKTVKGINAEPGIYTLKVFSPDNKGKYVLVVGEKEKWTATELLNTVYLMPQLKSDFFERPAHEAYFNIFGVFIILIVISGTGAIWVLVRKYRRKGK
ncbi:hypothetical protein [Methanohalophilus halophilus]|uniref:Uncharacterized protein n=1 Tax=Methanohalophilus halophilus TaxID=2177 RepID=A0A1L3PZH4_9EURY|nr:hypothetical protein [Methanohalophilus halophilus]APH38027.1 hypothetical protein BHR79_00050 [Methanohalophilus halophilus]RNI07307.1 hypothetical protein EFE40_10255 [Methanohalophilus halophilus]SDW86033.1 hypothetical protein SAMN04515625_1773 [Methanohalophilus halophilus]